MLETFIALLQTEPIGTASLGTIVGITGLVLVIVQVIKVLVPGNLAGWFFRLLALVVGAGLAVLAAGSGISSEVVPDLSTDGTFMLITFWLLVALNGLIAGLAAIGLFDTTRDAINGN